MSGHSKWAGIKHKKAIVDAKRGNLFTKLANAITVAAKMGGGDPNMNASLRMAVDQARAANMPKDNIERAIKRGTGELGGAAVEQLIYEGFGPGNVAIIVEALSDNRNRTNSDIRTVFSKTGGRIADSGVRFQFTQRGVVRLQVPAGQEETFEEAVIETAAEDYQVGEGFATVYTAIPELHTAKQALEDAGFKAESANIEWVANQPVEPEDEVLEKLAKLVDALEENDDVTSVYTNVA